MRLGIRAVWGYQVDLLNQLSMQVMTVAVKSFCRMAQRALKFPHTEVSNR